MRRSESLDMTAADVAPWLMYAVIALAVGVKFGVAILVARRLRDPFRQTRDRAKAPPVSIVVPISNLSVMEQRTVLSTLDIRYPEFEALFCLYDRSGRIFGSLRKAVDERPRVDARLLVGRDDVTRNPKLDNLAKAWTSTKYDLIAIVDAGVDAPVDLIDRLVDAWDDSTGVASSPPIGVQAENFWALTESAFLNTSQACWLMAADAFGLGFAHGKVMMIDRAVFDRIGGLSALASDTAEDSAATKAVRSIGRKVRIIRNPVPQPLGRRRWDEVWRRQLRWAQLRWESFPLVYLIEPLSTIATPLVAAVVLFDFADARLVVALMGGIAAIWYATENALASRAGWPNGPLYMLAAICRDLMTLALWPMGFFVKEYDWRGHKIKLRGLG